MATKKRERKVQPWLVLSISLILLVVFVLSLDNFFPGGIFGEAAKTVVQESLFMKGPVFFYSDDLSLSFKVTQKEGIFSIQKKNDVAPITLPALHTGEGINYYCKLDESPMKCEVGIADYIPEFCQTEVITSEAEVPVPAGGVPKPKPIKIPEFKIPACLKIEKIGTKIQVNLIQTGKTLAYTQNPAPVVWKVGVCELQPDGFTTIQEGTGTSDICFDNNVITCDQKTEKAILTIQDAADARCIHLAPQYFWLECDASKNGLRGTGEIVPFGLFQGGGPGISGDYYLCTEYQGKERWLTCGGNKKFESSFSIGEVYSDYQCTSNGWKELDPFCYDKKDGYGILEVSSGISILCKNKEHLECNKNTQKTIVTLGPDVLCTSTKVELPGISSKEMNIWIECDTNNKQESSGGVFATSGPKTVDGYSCSSVRGKEVWTPPRAGSQIRITPFT